MLISQSHVSICQKDYWLPLFNKFLEERRASANEALLGLNSYAHLLAAACSTMGVPSAADVNPQTTQNPSTQHPTVEEEGQSYLNHYGLSKRNTVKFVLSFFSKNKLISFYSFMLFLGCLH